MTLSLPKKHRTIRHSMAHSKTSKLAVYSLVCGIALGMGGSFTSNEVLADAGASQAEKAAPKDPIEKLKRRSALKRWKAISKGWNRSSKKESTASKTKAVQKSSAVKTESGPQLLSRQKSPQLQPVRTADSSAKRASTRRRPNAKPLNEAAPNVFYRTAQLNKSTQNDLESKRQSNEIKKITEINPFADYEPDAELAKSDACRNQCPRPDGTCSKAEGDDRVQVCPEVELLTEDEYTSRNIPASLYAWEAPNLYHNPLYFEDAQLERYGHTYNEAVQPFVSVGKFGIQLVGLPYQMAIDPINKKKYTLGWYRPGECAPKKHYQIPWNTKAAAVQAGATAGGILLVP